MIRWQAFIKEKNKLSTLSSKFENKRVLLWGYGREGKSSERFLNLYCNPACVEVFEGKRDDLPIDDFDYVIKSPGVPYIYTDEPKITSQTQMFLEEFAAQTIGITGTKGKSTTTSMLYKVLKDCLPSKVCLLGNIGLPCLDYYEDMKNGAVGVYEMSCHQLANNTLSPHVAIFLNLFEDHLDYYKTRDRYFEAKAHIAYFQKEDDYLFVGETVPNIKTDARVIKVDAFDEERYKLNVLGNHNQWNAEVVKSVATLVYGCDEDQVKKSLESFTGLPHRLEKFKTIGDVKFFDDSISTIPEATISAIESVKDAKTVIVGGMDRGIDYGPLIETIKERKDINFILCYASGKRILDFVKDCPNVQYVEDLKTATDLSKKITAAGSIIMSPAAASYGYFKNFEERGDYFKECVALKP